MIFPHPGGVSRTEARWAILKFGSAVEMLKKNYEFDCSRSTTDYD